MLILFDNFCTMVLKIIVVVWLKDQFFFKIKWPPKLIELQDLCLKRFLWVILAQKIGVFGGWGAKRGFRPRRVISQRRKEDQAWEKGTSGSEDRGPRFEKTRVFLRSSWRLSSSTGSIGTDAESAETDTTECWKSSDGSVLVSTEPERFQSEKPAEDFQTCRSNGHESDQPDFQSFNQKRDIERWEVLT